VSVRVCDELAGVGFGWIEEGGLGRCSHALAAGGRVWLVDPIEGEPVEELLRGLGDPAGVLQLLDRHNRACEAWADRLDVPLHQTPFEAVPNTPFQPVGIVRRRFWREVALWWPERRILVCADALGTVPSWRTGGQPLGVHPLLRLVPPRRLADLAPEHVLVGHGEGVHGPGAAAAVGEAVRTARRELPRAWLGSLQELRRRSRP
jgi:hypothetical protein